MFARGSRDLDLVDLMEGELKLPALHRREGESFLLEGPAAGSLCVCEDARLEEREPEMTVGRGSGGSGSVEPLAGAGLNAALEARLGMVWPPCRRRRPVTARLP